MKKTIVFIRGAPSPRLYNEVYALKKSKRYKIVLICRVFDYEYMRKFDELFDEVIYYQNPLVDIRRFGLTQNIKDYPVVHHIKGIMFDLLNLPIKKLYKPEWLIPSILQKVDADVFNCCGTEPTELTEIVLRNTNRPIVMDLHNGTIAFGIESLTKRRYEMDKYCFENVSGIIHRGSKYEIPYYKKHGYKINVPVFVYRDYCNKEFFADHNAKKLSDSDGECHIVSMGSGMNLTNILSIIKRVIKQRIHFHLYLIPHSITGINVYRKYFDLDKTNRYFHLEEPVPFHLVPKEIAKYDYGAILWNPKTTLDSNRCNQSYRIYSFMDANLPIIVLDEFEFMKQIIQDNKIGFSVTDNDIDKLADFIKNSDYRQLKENVSKTREKLSVDNYIEGLADFYDSITER